jgi:hypothetical protein
MKKINLAALAFEFDEEDPEGYRAGMARFGPSIDAVMLGGTVYELPPGQSVRRESHADYYDRER